MSVCMSQKNTMEEEIVCVDSILTMLPSVTVYLVFVYWPERGKPQVCTPVCIVTETSSHLFFKGSLLSHL